jgi:hypothetical protein
MIRTTSRLEVLLLLFSICDDSWSCLLVSSRHQDYHRQNWLSMVNYHPTVSSLDIMGMDIEQATRYLHSCSALPSQILSRASMPHQERTLNSSARRRTPWLLPMVHSKSATVLVTAIQLRLVALPINLASLRLVRAPHSPPVS